MTGKQNNSKNKNPINFISKWRSLPTYEMISYALMYASIPLLAYGIKPYNADIIKIVIFTILSLYSGYFAALIWNDITDADIDSIAHPDRPIPSGRISKNKFFGIALIFSATTFIFAYLVSTLCLIVTGFAALFVTFHDKYLKKRVKIPAYSEIFTPIQWIVVAIFGYFAIWTALPQHNSIVLSVSFLGDIQTKLPEVHNLLILILFTYFADNAHDIAEGIVDMKGDEIHGVKTYATSFGERKASIFSFIWFLMSGFFAVLLYIKTILSPLFLILFTINWLIIMRYSYKLLKTKGNKKDIAATVGRRGFDYFLISFNIIFFDILIQLIFENIAF